MKKFSMILAPMLLGSLLIVVVLGIIKKVKMKHKYGSDIYEEPCGCE